MAKKKTPAKKRPTTKTEGKLPSPKLPKLDLTDFASDLSKMGPAEVMEDGRAVRLQGVIPLGAPAIDTQVIGRGGIPLGRLSVIGGKEGGGKTTLCLHIVKAVQDMGGFGVYIEKEHKLDSTLIDAIGVDMGRCVLSRPEYLEKALVVIEGVVDKARRLREERGERVPCVIVVDSIDGIDPKSVYDAYKSGDGHESSHIAPTPRVLSHSLPRITELLEKEAVALVIVTQTRMKIGVTMGRKDGLTGGKALQFHACLILEPRHVGQIKEGGMAVGSRVKVTAIKNQIAAPFRSGEVDLIFGRGIDLRASLVEYANEIGVVDKEGRKAFSFEGAKLGMSLRQASRTLAKNPEMEARVRAAVAAEEAALKEDAG